MPHWFPGAAFKREGQKWLPHVNAMIDEPYAFVKAALVRLVIFLPEIRQKRDISWVQADGTAKVSVAASMTTKLNDKSTSEDIELAKILPANMYLGGADTVGFVNLESPMAH